MSRPVVALLLVAVILVASACGSSGGADKGSPAPAFSGKTLDGQQVTLAMYGGKPLILAFMASW